MPARAAGCERPGARALACVAIVLLCGLASLALGQDRSWDLRNYHLYNAYAWLHDRIGRVLHLVIEVVREQHQPHRHQHQEGDHQ